MNLELLDQGLREPVVVAMAAGFDALFSWDRLGDADSAPRARWVFAGV